MNHEIIDVSEIAREARIAVHQGKSSVPDKYKHNPDAVERWERACVLAVMEIEAELTI